MDDPADQELESEKNLIAMKILVNLEVQIVEITKKSILQTVTKPQWL